MNRIRHGLAVALVAALLFGCTQQPPPSQSAASSQAAYDPKKDPLVNPPEMLQPEPKDHPELISEDETIINHLEGNPTNLNPIFGSAAVDGEAAEPLYNGLFSYDAKMNWKVNDELVESVEDSPDHLQTTVKIRPGFTWQDGAPWTAQDVRFSWQAILDDRVPCPAVKDGTDQVADVVVVDDLTVKFVYKEAMVTNKWNMSFPVIPKHIFDNPEERAKDPTLLASEYYNRFNRNDVVGSGPYKLVEWVPNDRLVYERWEGYKGKKPHFKKLILKIQPDLNTSLLMFKRGDLDSINPIFPQQFAKETNDQEFAAHGHKAYGTEWTFTYIGWNMDGSNPFFADKRVRYAMTYAMNIKKVIEQVGYNLPTQCLGIFHPDSWMFDPQIKAIPYDLTLASKSLDEAGWAISQDDGLRYKEVNGKRVKFEFELFIPQGAATSEKIVAIYAEDLKKIGVSLKTRVLEWVAYQEATRKHEFQACIAAWGTGTDPDTNWNLWRTEAYKTGRNYGGFSNPRVDELLAQGRLEFDQAKRAKVYQEIGKIIYDEQPYLFIWNRPTLAAIHKRIRGVQFSPRGIFGFDPSWYGWWVPRDQALRQ